MHKNKSKHSNSLIFTPPQLSKESDGHFYWLDLIRFTAAFLVMACHYRGAFFVEYGLLPADQHNPLSFSFYILTRMGEEAVLVFFVLSGLLVGGKAMLRIADRTFSARSYALDRFVRIMLPLTSALGLWVLTCVITGSTIDWSNILGSLCSVQLIFTGCAFETLWSLVYEVWFYIVMFGIGVILTRRDRPFDIKYAIGLAVLLLCFFVFAKIGTFYLMIWLTGAVMMWKLLPANRLTLWAGALIMVFSIALLQYGKQSNLSENTWLTSGIGRDIVSLTLGISFALFIQQIIRHKPEHRFTLRLNTAGTRLAAFSYTLYLTHIPVMRLLEYLGFPKSGTLSLTSTGLYVASLGIGLIAAYAIYWLFERNTARVKRYLRDRLFKTRRPAINNPL